MPAGGSVNITCKNVSDMQDENLATADMLQRYVKITIADSGTGIPENIIERIFDPYFSTKHEGSGLGRSERDIGKLCAESSVLKGLAIRGGSVQSAKTDIIDWLRDLDQID